MRIRPCLGATCDQAAVALAEHHGSANEELDFIINYDIKYRMGDAQEEEG